MNWEWVYRAEESGEREIKRQRGEEKAQMNSQKPYFQITLTLAPAQPILPKTSIYARCTYSKIIICLDFKICSF
jgi:hypothetical protein